TPRPNARFLPRRGPPGTRPGEGRDRGWPHVESGRMDVEAIRAALAPDGGERERAGLGAFLAGLDRLYFSRGAPESVAAHVRMAAGLGPSCPARVAVTPRDDGRYDVAVVAFDYFAILSVLCGLLAVHRLSIESGHAHTLVLPAPPDVQSVPVRW